MPPSPEPHFAGSSADYWEGTLQSQIGIALRQLKAGSRPAGREAEMKMELLEALRRRLEETDKTDAARLVESVRANGLRVAADTHPGDPTVSVDMGSLTRMVEAIAGLSPKAPPVSATGSIPSTSDRPPPLPDHSVCHELAQASREAQGRVCAVLDSEPDPDRQWHRVVALIDEGGHPPRDLEVDLSDNSFLYSR